MICHLIDIKRFVALCLLLSACLVNVLHAQTAADSSYVPVVSPFDFCLAEATTDSARYEVLYETHLQAFNAGVDVSYRGVGALTIEVTAKSRPIPLTRHSDFSGLHLTVKNTTKEHYLFEMLDTAWTAIDLSAGTVDTGDFSGAFPFQESTYLVLLEDRHPWVNLREGHKYGAMRKDILLVQNGKSLNHPISPYSTDSTLLSAHYQLTDEELKTIANLTIMRDSSSTAKTYCFKIEGVNNLKISDVNIYTPDPKNLYSDAAITIRNSTNVTFENVLIEGTYSRKNLYGYGILMDNVWNSTFLRLRARGNWGIFGTNNLNRTTLRDCEINRFDIHCYGRDVSLHNCSFGNLYNQFSSVFGTVLFDGCRFTDFVPVLLEPSYNAYTRFSLVFQNCIFDALPGRNFLVSTGKLDNTKNARPELARKCWPNVTIRNMTVNVSTKVSKVVLFQPKELNPNVSVSVSSIEIDGLRFHYRDTTQLADFVVCSKKVNASGAINYDFNKVELIPSPKRMKQQATRKNFYPGCLVFNLRHNKSDNIQVSASRLNYNVNENGFYNITYNNCDVGLIRYTSNNNGTKRSYNRCSLYLNNDDDARYYIDNHAVYNGCTFIPCNDRMTIGFYGNDNDVVIKNCKTTRTGRLFYLGHSNNIELNHYEVKGTAKRL